MELTCNGFSLVKLVHSSYQPESLIESFLRDCTSSKSHSNENKEFKITMHHIT